MNDGRIEVAREKVIKFAKRLYNQKYKRSVDSSIRGAIELQWGSINTMRPSECCVCL